MKRGLVFTLCALAAASLASSAMAQSTVDVSLNLRYTDPANPAEGGTWNLVAKTNDAQGLAGLVVYLQNAGNAAAATMATNIGAITSLPGDAETFLDRTGGILEVVYAQNPAVTALNVGTAGFGPRITTDPLRNTNWNNASIIANGNFGATRPTFATFEGSMGVATTLVRNTPSGTNASEAATLNTPVVRGDSLNTLNLEHPSGQEGLRYGDRNRDFQVSITTDILPALGQIGQPGVKGWDDGDFNNNGSVSITQDILPALGQVGQPGLPVSVGAVPEPATAGLALVGLLGLAAVRRRMA